jgi:hypothetical protein
MSTEPHEIEGAVSELTRAMSRLLRAIDAAGDDGEAARHVPERMVEELERLAARLSAAQGIGG